VKKIRNKENQNNKLNLKNVLRKKSKYVFRTRKKDRKKNNKLDNNQIELIKRDNLIYTTIKISFY